MIGIVITGHGSFPKGILESLHLIAGDVENLVMVPFEDDPVELETSLQQAIEQVDSDSGVVCFADLAGGTPFNVSSRIAAYKDDLRVIGGTNLPMILSCLFKRNQPLDDFVKTALNEGKENIKAFEIKKSERVVEDLTMDGI